MNPHLAKPTSLVSIGRSFWLNRGIIYQVSRREIVGRYKGSVLGGLWSFINPLMMLAVYTFVFSYILKAKWSGAQSGDPFEYPLLLLSGMIVHSFFAEVLLRAPSAIVANVSFVKKIVFPLEVLPITILAAAIFHFGISLILFVGLFLLTHGFVHWTSIFLPIILLPLILIATGVAWFLASLGVFLRDINQPLSLLVTLLLFGSPVFYPVTALPEDIRPFLMLNPLTFIIDQVRVVVISGSQPNWNGLLIYLGVAVILMWLGYVCFQKTRRGFSDVL